MIKRAPPLHALYAFEAVARLSSFAKAALELNVTRSAISHRIQMLERLLDAPVFERGPRSLNLTPTGASYLILVKRALLALDDVAAQSGESPSKTRITLTAPPTFSRLVVMPRLKEFLAQHPHVEIALEISQSQLDYRAGEFDLDIRFGTGLHEGRQSQLLLNEVIFPVASPAYIARHELKDPQDLTRAQLLRSRLEPWRPWFDAAGLDWEEPDGGHRLEDLSLLYQAAAQGLGVALARASLARPLLENGTLQSLFGVVAKSDYAYYAVYDQGVLNRPEVADLLAWLLQITPASPPCSTERPST